MIYTGIPQNYDGYPNFTDRSTTMALRREKFDVWKRKRAKEKWLKEKQEIEERNKQKLKRGEPKENLEAIPDPPIEPDDPRNHYEWDENDGIGEEGKGETQTLKQIFGKMFDYVYSGDVCSYKFEDRYSKTFPRLEVMKLSRGECGKKMAKRAEESTRENENRIKNKLKENPNSLPKTVASCQKIKDMSVDEWILCVINLFKSIPPLVTLIDLDVKRIAFNSGRYNVKHCSTISQIETILRLKEQKEMLLNIYVLNKFFAGLTLNYQERMVFLCVMQKSLPAEKITSQKLRTAYRTRRVMLRRFREFCLRRGYTAEWFYNHFAFLPCVKYYVENTKAKEDKHLKELEMEKNEHKNLGVDPLAFLGDENNIEGEPAFHKNLNKKKALNKEKRRSRNLWAEESGVGIDKVKRNEAKSFAYRLSSATEFDRLVANLSPEKQARVEKSISARHSSSVLSDYMQEVEDYESGMSI